MMQNHLILLLSNVLHLILFHSIKFENKYFKQSTMPSTMFVRHSVRNVEISLFHNEKSFFSWKTPKPLNKMQPKNVCFLGLSISRRMRYGSSKSVQSFVQEACFFHEKSRINKSCLK